MAVPVVGGSRLASGAGDGYAVGSDGDNGGSTANLSLDGSAIKHPRSASDGRRSHADKETYLN